MMFPTMRPIADTGVLIEFGDHIADDIHARVLSMDAAVTDAALYGVTELIPTYAALYVAYDALAVDYTTLITQLNAMVGQGGALATEPTHWDIPVCYHSDFAPDLPELASALGLSESAVIEHHASVTYKVYMYGFAPGYAYLGGVPKVIQHPRKAAPTMGVAPQSAMVAGSQALITTVTMPSGWWVIGRTGVNPLRADHADPFMFAVGDTVGFEPMSRIDFDKFGWA
jgi:inhibitor of KinA